MTTPDAAEQLPRPDERRPEALRRDPDGPSLPDVLAVVDQLPAMVAYWDGQARNRFANRAYIEWFGLEPAQIRGMHIRDLLGPEVYALNRPYIEGALAGRHQLFERTLVDSHGTTRYTQASYTPRVVDGRLDGFFVLVTDISARVEAENALRETTGKLALMRERERIATDLHDLVIQRLFAAGLELSAVRDLVSADVRRRIDAGVEGIDDAVTELRSSIYSLTRGDVQDQLADEIERVVHRAGRALGFEPQLACAGDLDAVPPHVAGEILAVLTEALSNAARHASSATLEVGIDVSPDGVRLPVADDGRGIGDATRTSGLTNMRVRAERLGGTCRWLPNDPTGTVVEWWVPTPAPR